MGVTEWPLTEVLFTTVTASSQPNIKSQKAALCQNSLRASERQKFSQISKQICKDIGIRGHDGDDICRMQVPILSEERTVAKQLSRSPDGKGGPSPRAKKWKDVKM